MRKILSAIVLALIFTACGTMNLGGKVKKVELGMTKKEIISVLGGSYSVEGAAVAAEGTFETLRFEDALYPQTYVFIFLNGELVEWFERKAPPSVQVHTHTQESH